MIDLHCHVLPGLDDGPETLEQSLEMARVAQSGGIETIVATPHVRDDYPFELGLIFERAAELNHALQDAGVDVDIRAGGEVSLAKVGELQPDELSAVALGRSPYMLVESPYTEVTDLLEATLFDLQVRGFVPVLAHPERNPSFQVDASRLAALVERGILCSITAGSLAGRFGRTVRRFAIQLMDDGLVHNVASDAHDAERRPPLLSEGLNAVKDEQMASASANWLTLDVPRAILAAEALPERPEELQSVARRRRFRLRMPGRDGR